MTLSSIYKVGVVVDRSLKDSHLWFKKNSAQGE